MTPAQLAIAAKARIDVLMLDQQIAQANNYSLACLIRTAVWGKKMPDFDKLTRQGRKPNNSEEMTDQQMLNSLTAITKALGGSVEE